MNLPLPHQRPYTQGLKLFENIMIAIAVVIPAIALVLIVLGALVAAVKALKTKKGRIQLTTAVAVIFLAVMATDKVVSESESRRIAEDLATSGLRHDIRGNDAARILGLPTDMHSWDNSPAQVEVNIQEYNLSGEDDFVNAQLHFNGRSYNLYTPKSKIELHPTGEKQDVEVFYTYKHDLGLLGHTTTYSYPPAELDSYPERIQDCRKDDLLIDYISATCIVKSIDDEHGEVYTEYEIWKQLYDNGAQSFIDYEVSVHLSEP